MVYTRHGHKFLHNLALPSMTEKEGESGKGGILTITFILKKNYCQV